MVLSRLVHNKGSRWPLLSPGLDWGLLTEAVELWDYGWYGWNLIHESTYVVNEVMLPESTLVSI